MEQDRYNHDLEKHDQQQGESDSLGAPKQEAGLHNGRISQSEAIFPNNENENKPQEPDLPEGVLGRALSKVISHVSTLDVGPPPDGGLKAWTQAFMAHLVVANTWGYISSYGVFQTYYVMALNQPPSSISWVGSVQIFLLFFIGTFSGRATDYGLFRPTFILGSMFQLLGVFMTSLSTKYWHLFLAQGICTGIGNGLVFCPILALLSTYFSSNRSLAIGIAASGTATGGVVYPVIVRQLLPRVGFPWTVRVIGFVMFGIQCVTIAFTRTRLPPRRSGPIVELQAFKELPYAMYCVAMFLVFWGLYFAFYYIGSFGRDVLNLSRNDSINLLLILNGVGLFGRLIPAYLADKYFGPLNLIGPVTFVAGVLLYCWAAVSSSNGLIAFAVVYGLFAAGIQSLFPATLSSLTTDLKKAGVRMGMCFSVISFACLTGSPIAGALIEKDGGQYLHAQLYAGSIMVVGSALLVLTRVAKIGWKRGRV